VLNFSLFLITCYRYTYSFSWQASRKRWL